MVGRNPMSMAMTIGPVAAAMKSMMVWFSASLPANPRVNRLDPDSRMAPPSPFSPTP